MTRTELLETLVHLDTQQQLEWMLALGAALTVAARNAYGLGTEQADGKALRGYNEIQHRVFARIRDTAQGREWSLGSFVAMIHETAEAYGIEGDVGWALKYSLPKLDLVD